MSGCFICGGNKDMFFTATEADQGSGVSPWLWFLGFAAAGGMLIYWLRRKEGVQGG